MSPSQVPLVAPKVLLVEDDPLLRRAMQRLLQTRVELVVVGSAEEALRQLTQPVAFDAIVCDVMLPGMNGLELYQELCARRSRFAGKMIFVSGGAFGTSVLRLQAIPNPCFEKPVEIEDLCSAIARLMG